MEYNIFVKSDTIFKNEQIQLWKNNLKNISDSRYNWFYEENPYAVPLTVLAKAENDSVVGSCSLYARDLIGNNSVMRIGIASDFAINEKHRVYGPALKMQRLLVEEGLKQNFDLLFAFPNNNSRALFQRVGYKKLGAINNGVKVLKSKRWISRKVSNKLISTLISLFVDWSFWVFDHVVYLLNGSGYRVESGFATADDYDGLWERAKNNYPIVGEKSAQYLKWRYVDNPSKEYNFFNVYNKQRELKGFVVYSIANTQVTLEELFVESPSLKIGFLLSKFILFVRKQKADQINFGYLGFPSVLNEFKKHLFFIKPENRFCLILPSTDHTADSTKLFNTNNWFLFESEMDL